MEIKIRQKPQRSTGKTSLVLEYYYGYTRDDEGRIKHRRKFETLEYYLYTDPKNKLERDHNKVNLEMAEKVKAKRLLAEQNEQYGFAVKYKIRTDLVEYIKGLIEQRKESPGNWGNWDSALKHLVAYAGTNTTFEMVDKKFVEGFKTYLAKQANADMILLDYVQMMYYFFSTKLTGWPSVIPGAPQTSTITPVSNVIFLDGGGKRVANEDEFCFDYVQKNWEGGYEEGWTLVGDAFAKQYPDVIEIALSSELGSRDGKMGYTGNTIEEVCEGTGLDPEIVQATVDRYNELCAKGEDLDFGKPAEYMESIEAPFYLLRMPMVCTDGYSGARINLNAQVIDVNGDVIPGFYAAGSCAVAQMSSVRYYGCGSSLLFGGTYGRIAAQHAVENLEK